MSVFVARRFAPYGVLGLGSVAYGAYWYQYVRTQQRASSEASQFKTVGSGLADVGRGRFVLVDSRDALAKSERELFGDAWNLVYFGYTHCPDICPAELKRMTQLLLWAENDGLPLQPYLISIDGQRDTVGQLRRYLREFHPRIAGLTGTPEQLADVAKQYRMYSFRSGDPADLANDDYLVDHSIFIILVSPQGKFVDYFGPKMPLDTVYKRIRFHTRDAQ
jgi:protein SCO1